MSETGTPAKVASNEKFGPLPESAAFETWFLLRYNYSRAVLTNPIWVREIADAAEAFSAGQAAERARCAQYLLQVAADCPDGGPVRATLEACAGAIMLGGLNVRGNARP